MMMMGDGASNHSHSNPAAHGPPWSLFDDPASDAAAGYSLPVSGVSVGGDCSPYMLAALRRYLPSNDSDAYDSDESEPPVDAYTCDEFRMYEFKVRRCARGRSHDWTECPYAHPGEKARRRDPRKYHYSGAACPDFRKGSCKRGDACEFAHGVFECWLHPARYRTQPCKDGTACRRRVCFFAHTPDQLRVLPPPSSPRAAASAAAPESYDGSPLRRHSLDEYFRKSLLTSSPTSTLLSPPVSPPSESPPVSPSSWPAAGVGINEVLASLRQLQLSKVKSMPSSWGNRVGRSGGVYGFRGGFCSLPTTPTRSGAAVGGAGGWIEGMDGGYLEEEPVERVVESGRALRARMFEKLSKESGLDRPAPPAGPAPDVGWVSELVM